MRTTTGRILGLLGLFFLPVTTAFSASPFHVTFQRSRSVAFSTSMSKDEGQETTTNAVQTEGTGDHSAVIEYLKSAEIQEVRQELIMKYVQLGKSPEDAERDVDDFLSDPEQSNQYLEMRRYAKAQADELGFDLYFQLGGAFFIGLAATSLPKYYNAYKVRFRGIYVFASFSFQMWFSWFSLVPMQTVYPDGGGPIPFL